MLDEVNRYRILKSLENHPDISQRELAKELGISLGKVNYCIGALVEKGLIKVNNFQSNPNKRSYIYLLTPRGLEAKANLTIAFLKIKMQEYEALNKEIESLRCEVDQLHEVKS